MIDSIIIRGARLHNLKNISVSIPKNQLVVLTGVSGSGKSTLGFDILLKEGMRQYLESLGFVTWGVSKPPVDSISGLSPTLSLDQQPGNRSPRSTVGTATEVYTYLRILFARLGRRHCPACGKEVSPSYNISSPDWEGNSEAADGEEITFPCPHCGEPLVELGMAHFSFNKPAGACPTCTGLGSIHRVNIRRLVDDQKSVAEGAVAGWEQALIDYHCGVLRAAAAHYGLDFDPARPVKEFSAPLRDLLFYGVVSPQFQRYYPALQPPATARQGRFEGVATSLLRRYAEHIHDEDYTEKIGEFLLTQTCPDCAGTRLRPESRAVTVSGQNIVALSHLPLTELNGWLTNLPDALDIDEKRIAEPLLADLGERVTRLVEVGAGYLTLERGSPSLSAGEIQRLRLASLLGSSLTGLLYIFDEPTIGLHQRDTRRMIGVLRRLRDLGNTVLVVEHDLEMIASADYVIDFGPGAGRHGGQVVASGTPAEIVAQPSSLTGDYLAGQVRLPASSRRRSADGMALTIRGARHNNLQNLTVRLPLGMLVAVTGVSGSGKSSLVFDVLDRTLRQHFYGASDPPGEYDSIEGLDQLSKVITIDQTHLGRLPRSNAATYSEAFTPIREIFAAVSEARQRGLSTRHFSFNVPGGRCEHCKGSGSLSVPMYFLPDVEVRCPTCRGRRFKEEILCIQYRGQDISQVLELTVAEALELFSEVPAARSRLQALADVGLGYLSLGQPADTLSGGEAQRVKLAKELGRRPSRRTLYLFDEPTTGLHLADTARLLEVLQRLVDAGNSVIVIEHNLALIKAADWVIDLGPEGGSGGGRLVAEGTPEQIAQIEGSYTGQFLREILTA